ncbi:hypothetical protein NZK27_03040 [Synechococcus sp. FGCU-3]|nr:hypothetical protein [Synechococcus sp. FGCU3]
MDTLTRRPPRPLWQIKRAWLIGLPVGVLTFLLAIAPPIPEAQRAGAPLLTRADGQPFRYLPDNDTYALDFDPRQVQIDLFEGWDREQEAYADPGALAFVSGPMYERHVEAGGREITVPLGDLKFGDRVWRGRNRTAARQRAYVGIRHDGGVEFGYGELTPERARRFESFIGGLHSIYNDLEPPPPDYRGAYSVSMGQQIRYFLPRIRMLIGLRPDGRMEVLMSRDGLTLEQTRALARSRGLRAAYMPDHASKSRFIVPGAKGFSDADANWISGGATSFVHVPYMLRLSRRAVPLQGSLLAGLAVSGGPAGCGNPFQCGQTLGGQVVDRILAGLNRLIEQGVEPVARLIWAPRGNGNQRPSQRAPFREPPISADPLALQARQQQEIEGTLAAGEAPAPLELPADNALAAPEMLPADPASTDREAATAGNETPAVGPPGAATAMPAVSPAAPAATGVPLAPLPPPLPPPTPN